MNTYQTWRWRIFAATWLSYAGYYFCRKPYFIVKEDIAETYSWSPSTLGTIGAAYLIAYAIGQFVAGGLGERFGARVLLLGGMALTAVVNAAFGVTNRWELFAALMALNGLAQATGWAPNVATMGRWFRHEERGTIMGIWATNFQGGGIAANALASYMLGTALGWQWSFWAGSLVLLGVWAFFLFNQRDRPEDVGLPAVDGEATTASGAQPVADPGWTREVLTNVLIMGTFYFFVKFIRYALWSWAPYLLQKNFHLEGDDAGYLSTVFDVTGVVGVIAAGIVSDRLFRSRHANMSLVFIVGMTISCLFLYTAGSSSLLVFTVCMGLIGFTLHGPDAIMTSAGAVDVGSRRTALMAAAIINGMGSFGAVVQELLIGKILDKDTNAGPLFGLLLGSSLLATFCLTVLVWRGRSGRSKV